MIRRCLPLFCALLGGLASGPLALAQSPEEAAKELAVQISATLDQHALTRVGIVTFTDLEKRPSTLGKFIVEELNTQLFQAGKRQLRIFERERLEAVIGELERSANGQLRNAPGRGFLGLEGVDAVLIGTIAELPSRLRINARLVSVPAGELLATAAVSMCREGASGSAPSVVGQAEGSTAKSDEAAVLLSLTVQQIRFDLLGCTKERAEIRCRLTVVNEGEDCEVTLDTERAYLYDQSSSTLPASSLQLGSHSESWGARARMPNSIPMPMVVHFRGNPTAVTKLSYLALAARGCRFAGDDISFKGVDLLR